MFAAFLELIGGALISERLSSLTQIYQLDRLKEKLREELEAYFNAVIDNTDYKKLFNNPDFVCFQKEDALLYHVLCYYDTMSVDHNRNVIFNKCIRAVPTVNQPVLRKAIDGLYDCVGNLLASKMSPQTKTYGTQSK